MSDYTFRIGDREFTAAVRELTADRARVVVDGTEYEVDLVELGQHRAAPKPTRPAPAAVPSAPVAASRPAPTPAAGGALVAPLPGLVLELKVNEGQQVQAGQPVVVMEAMKMENVIPASHTGTVRKVFVQQGDSVGEGDPLVEIARPEMTTL